jgi:hypothetical protein
MRFAQSWRDYDYQILTCAVPSRYLPAPGLLRDAVTPDVQRLWSQQLRPRTTQHIEGCGAGAALGAAGTLVTGIAEGTLGVGLVAVAGLGCVGEMATFAVEGEIGGPDGDLTGLTMHGVQSAGDWCWEFC